MQVTPTMNNCTTPKKMTVQATGKALKYVEGFLPTSLTMWVNFVKKLTEGGKIMEEEENKPTGGGKRQARKC